MKKVTVKIEDTIKYIEEITVEIPDDMTDNDVYELAQRAVEKYPDGSAKDVAQVLESDNGLKVVEQSNNFPNDPQSSDLYVDDTYYYKGLSVEDAQYKDDE
jgi:hypothetical protein